MSQTLPPPPGPRPPEQNTWLHLLAILLATGGGLAILLVLNFVTMNALAPVLAIGAGIFLFAGFHYIAWGWWLSHALRDEIAQAEREAAEEDAQSPDPLRKSEP